MEDGVQSSNRLNITDENSLGVDLETGLMVPANIETDPPKDNHHLQHQDKNSLGADLETGLMVPENIETEPPNDNHHLQHQDKINSLRLELGTGLMVPENKETYPPNDLETGLQQQGATSPGGAIESGTKKASAASDEKKLIEEIRKAKGKTKSEFATIAMLFGLLEALCIMFLPEKSANENILKAVSILGSLAFGAGFCLLIHTFFMLAPNNTITHPIHHTISKILIIFASTALLASLIPLLLLPSPYNLLIPIVMAAVLLTLCINLYISFKTNDKETEKDKTQYEKKMKEIPCLSELSQGVVSLSSGGLIGVLFGIHTNASNHAHHPVVSASVFLSFTCFIISICLMVLCQMRLMHLSFSTIKVFLGLCKFLLVLLAFSALAIAFTFLNWYTVLVVIPVLIVFSVWLFKLWATHNIQDTLEEDDLKLACTKGNKVSSISFGGITAIFSGYLGRVEKNTHLNICMMFLASAFLSGQSLILLSYKPSTTSHIGFAVNILTYVAISLLVFGVFIIFILEFMGL